MHGTSSDDIELAASVFQGTVLGPPLWNTSFSDIALPARSSGGREAMFADDLNVFESFVRLKAPEGCKAVLKKRKDNVQNGVKEIG